MKLDSTVLFDEFSGWHRERRNRLCHDLGLPLISFAVLGVLGKLPVGWVFPGLGAMDVGALLLAGTLLFDLRFFPRQAAGVFGMGALLWWVARSTSIPLLGAAFVLGWGFQLVGHRLIEGNAPLFTTNLVHLLVGPRWLVRRWVGLLRGEPL